MSTENNKAIVRRFAQVWGKGNLNIVDELAAPTISVSYPLLPETVHGPLALKQAVMMAHSGLPDTDVTIDPPFAYSTYE